MHNSKKVILFDIDYTLFDTDRFREKQYQAFASVLQKESQALSQIGEKVHDRLAREVGFFDPDLFVQGLAEEVGDITKKEVLKQSIWDTQNFGACLYKETKSVLKALGAYATIGIFSKGHTEFQRAKLAIVKEFFEDQHIHITLNKSESLPKLIKKYEDTTLYLVDDALDVLSFATNLRPDIKTIWVKRGRFAKTQQPIKGFVPTRAIMTLDELGPIIQGDK